MKKFFFFSFFLIFYLAILVLALRGVAGSPSIQEINSPKWVDQGPLELSPDRGRFALTLSYVENHSFHFSLPIAQFAAPDVGYKDGNYVSLFAPGISFIIMPGYLIGKMVGLSQVGAFSVISLFALLNAGLIMAICRRLKVNPLAAALGSLVFLFATPAFTYSVTLYQHHISTFLILLSIYCLIRWNTIWSLGAIWLLCAASIPVDYPNLFLMLPIAFSAFTKSIILNLRKHSMNFKIRIGALFAIGVVILPLAFFMWFNQASYNNPFQFSGTVEQVKEIDAQGRIVKDKQVRVSSSNADDLLLKDKPKKSALRFFKARNLLNGFYIHFISPDRGILWYTPIILLGIFGMVHLYRKKSETFVIILGVIGFNVLLYSMWTDPWGGWAFGSRYLIPSYSLMSVFVAIALSSFRKKKIFLIVFAILLAYSVGVNTLGAITSSKNPPHVEILELEKITHKTEKFTFERNISYIQNNYLKSFIWQTYAKQYFSASEYYFLLFAAILSVGYSSVVLLWLAKGGAYEI